MLEGGYRQRGSREGIEDRGHVELASEESLNDGYVHHPDVVHEASDHGPARPGARRRGAGTRPFLSRPMRRTERNER